MEYRRLHRHCRTSRANGKTKVTAMFAFIAALVFFAAAIMALTTIGLMLSAYRDKMVAALLFEPIPEAAPVYRIEISRRRAALRTRPVAMSIASLAA